jgi:hypothetical protein
MEGFPWILSFRCQYQEFLIIAHFSPTGGQTESPGTVPDLSEGVETVD